MDCKGSAVAVVAAVEDSRGQTDRGTSGTQQVVFFRHGIYGSRVYYRVINQLFIGG